MVTALPGGRRAQNQLLDRMIGQLTLEQRNNGTAVAGNTGDNATGRGGNPLVPSFDQIRDVPQFGDFVQRMKEATEDGVVTRRERRQLRRSLSRSIDDSQRSARDTLNNGRGNPTARMA